MANRILASYVLRIVVADGRWRLELLDVRSGAAWTFDAFDALSAHLERLARGSPP